MYRVVDLLPLRPAPRRRRVRRAEPIDEHTPRRRSPSRAPTSRRATPCSGSSGSASELRVPGRGAVVRRRRAPDRDRVDAWASRGRRSGSGYSPSRERAARLLEGDPMTEPLARSPATSTPLALRLDALVTGDADAPATAHVASCVDCAAYVERLRREVDAFAAAPRLEPEAFVQAVARRRALEATRRRRARWLGATTSAVLALAACVALFVHVRPPAAPVADAPIEAPSAGPIRFKGGAQVAVVLERHGAQSRETGVLEHRARRPDPRRDRARSRRRRPRPACSPTTARLGGVASSASRLTAGTHFSEGRSPSISESTPAG